VFDLILQSVQQHDLELARQRDDAARRVAEELRLQRKAAGLMSMSDVQDWLDGQVERETEKLRPAAKETSDVDVPKPSGSRFPPPPRRG
jgi:hypothetical protein